MAFRRSRILRISRAAISISVACPAKPDIRGWWITILELGSAKRLPFAPPASSTAAIEAAWPVDVEHDVLVGILGLQEQHLRDHQIGDVVVNRRADEDDAVLEKPREDVVGPFAAVGLLDDHWHKLHARIGKLMTHKRFAG